MWFIRTLNSKCRTIDITLERDKLTYPMFRSHHVLIVKQQRAEPVFQVKASPRIADLRKDMFEIDKLTKNSLLERI